MVWGTSTTLSWYALLLERNILVIEVPGECTRGAWAPSCRLYLRSLHVSKDNLGERHWDNAIHCKFSNKSVVLFYLPGVAFDADTIVLIFDQGHYWPAIVQKRDVRADCLGIPVIDL